MTEFGWAERTLFNVAYASVQFDDFVFLPQHFRRVHTSFVHFGRNLVTLSALALTAHITIEGLYDLFDYVFPQEEGAEVAQQPGMEKPTDGN
jgi:hypothetical protein